MSKIQFGQMYVSYNPRSMERKIAELTKKNIPYATHTLLTEQDIADAKAAGQDFSGTSDLEYSVLIGTGKRDKARIERLSKLSDESPSSSVPGVIQLGKKTSYEFKYLIHGKELV